MGIGNSCVGIYVHRTIIYFRDFQEVAPLFFRNEHCDIMNSFIASCVDRSIIANCFTAKWARQCLMNGTGNSIGTIWQGRGMGILSSA